MIDSKKTNKSKEANIDYVLLVENLKKELDKYKNLFKNQKTDNKGLIAQLKQMTKEKENNEKPLKELQEILDKTKEKLSKNYEAMETLKGQLNDAVDLISALTKDKLQLEKKVEALDSELFGVKESFNFKLEQGINRGVSKATARITKELKIERGNTKNTSNQLKSLQTKHTSTNHILNSKISDLTRSLENEKQKYMSLLSKYKDCMDKYSSLLSEFDEYKEQHPVPLFFSSETNSLNLNLVLEEPEQEENTPKGIITVAELLNVELKEVDKSKVTSIPVVLASTPKKNKSKRGKKKEEVVIKETESQVENQYGHIIKPDLGKEVKVLIVSTPSEGVEYRNYLQKYTVFEVSFIDSFEKSSVHVKREMDKADIVILCVDRMEHSVLQSIPEEAGVKYQYLPNDNVKKCYDRVVFTYNFLQALNN